MREGTVLPGERSENRAFVHTGDHELAGTVSLRTLVIIELGQLILSRGQDGARPALVRFKSPNERTNKALPDRAPGHNSSTRRPAICARFQATDALVSSAMVEYRIPGAEFFSTAVIVVCFVIALIVINMQEAGRFRTFGVLGVVSLFGSGIVEAVNRSLGGAYGTKSGIYSVGSVIVALLAAGGLVLLSLSVVWARKARKQRGGHR